MMTMEITLKIQIPGRHPISTVVHLPSGFRRNPTAGIAPGDGGGGKQKGRM